MSAIRTLFKDTGPYLPLTALFLAVQVSLARHANDFNGIEWRLFIALFAGLIVSFLLTDLLRSYRGRSATRLPLARLPLAFLEKAGLHLFTVSFFSFTQLHWARSHQRFGDLELRLIGALLVGSGAAALIHLLLRRSHLHPRDAEGAAGRLSVAASPGILFLFASADMVWLILAPLFCLLLWGALGAADSWRAASPRPSKLFRTALFALLGAALFLRTWGLDYDTDHPDGAKQVTAAMRYVYGDYTYSLGHPVDVVRGYPYFSMHLVEVTYRAYSAAARHFAPQRPTPREAKSAKDASFKFFIRHLCRSLNVLYQILSVILVTLVGARLFGRRAGLAAALFFAFSALQIGMTHLVNADVPSALFVLLSMYVAAGLRERERPGGYFGAGAFAGLAAASKYHGVFALLFVFLIFLELRLRERRAKISPLRAFGTASWTVFGFVVAFLLATPVFLLEPGAAWESLSVYRAAMDTYHVPEAFLDRRLALFFHRLPHHLNTFLRFFEPIPGWAAVGALLLFWLRFGRRMAFVWIYPLLLFPLGAYTHNTAAPYHYMGVLAPFFWILGSAAAGLLERVRPVLLRRGAAAALALWLGLSAFSDTSMFSLPSTRRISEAWLARRADGGLFESAFHRAEDNSPRIFGFAPWRPEEEDPRERAGANRPVASFDVERRVPTLNHWRNRPWRIFWEDGEEHRTDFFPPPRRASTEDADFIFPENPEWGRDPGLFMMRPGAEYVRRIRFSGEESWAIYAHHPLSGKEGPPATLTVRAPGSRRLFRLPEGEDLREELALRRPDRLAGGAFSTLRLVSDRPLLLQLVSPGERGWHLLMAERWDALAELEKGRGGLLSRARLAVALHRLGGDVPGREALRRDLESDLPGMLGEDPAPLFPLWSGGLDLSLFDDPAPALPLYHFSVVGDAGKERWPLLDPGSRVVGPYAMLLPGFYRVVFVLAGTGSEGPLDFSVTTDMGRRVLARRTAPVPGGTAEVDLPFRVSASEPGWNMEFLLSNRGSGPVRVEEIRLENDPARQFAWWIGEVREALGAPTAAPR